MTAADPPGAKTAATPSAVAAKQSVRRRCPSVAAKPRAAKPLPPYRHRTKRQAAGPTLAKGVMARNPSAGDSGQNFPHYAVGGERGHVRRGHGRRDHLD